MYFAIAVNRGFMMGLGIGIAGTLLYVNKGDKIKEELNKQTSSMEPVRTDTP
jgi:hypothetical protein